MLSRSKRVYISYNLQSVNYCQVGYKNIKKTPEYLSYHLYSVVVLHKSVSSTRLD